MGAFPLALLMVLCVTTMEAKDHVVGIDLGTTFSVVGVYENGQVSIIANHLGNRLTPSWVAFSDSERLIGEAAKNQVSRNPTNTVYDVKRFIGRSWSDPAVQRDKAAYSFAVVERGNKPSIDVEYKGKRTILRPEEVSAMVLGYLKEVAEEYLGGPVSKAVITVPAYFNDDQRQATKNAGTIAGLEVLRIINEPTAAAIAYGLDKVTDGKTIAVCDFGGGTYDVSMLRLDDGIFQVLATNGDTHLGGEDLDAAVTQYFVDMFRQKEGVDFSKNSRAVQRLRSTVEKAKIQLSTAVETWIDVEAIAEGKDMHYKLTRAKFEELCMPFFKRLLEPLRKVLEDGKKDVDDIDEVVMVGGSTRIPKVREMIQKFFRGKELNLGVNPDEAVAYGAAIQAGILSGDKIRAGGGSGGEILLLDVTPLSLGVETTGGIMTTLIPRNSMIPVKKSKDFTTENDNQLSMPIRVFQGERPMTKDNHFIGEFVLHGLPPAKRGVPKVDVTFSIDASGILTVTAKDRATGKEKSTTITSSASRLTEKEIKRMVRDAERFKDDDIAVKEKAEARLALEHYIYDMKSSLTGALGKKLDLETRHEATTKLEQASEWLSGHPRADKSDYDEQKEELSLFWNPIVERLYQERGQAGEGGGEEEAGAEPEDDLDGDHRGRGAAKQGKGRKDSGSGSSGGSGTGKAGGKSASDSKGARPGRGDKAAKEYKGGRDRYQPGQGRGRPHSERDYSNDDNGEDDHDDL